MKRFLAIILVVTMIFMAVPMTASAEEMSRKCGENLTWKLEELPTEYEYQEEYKLIISGTGAMYDYDYNAPWGAYTDDISTVEIETGVTSIGENAFCDCTNLASITIPNSVTSIGDRSFKGCISLASITIPNSVTSIGDWAFSGCTSLASITIPNSVTSIGYCEFNGCTSLASITIPNSVTSIGGWSFAGCTSLASITIPNSVTSVGAYAFNGCTSLTDVYFTGTEEQWNNIKIYSDNEWLTTANIHYNYQPETEVIQGDANGDGKVTAVDARMVLQYVAGLLTITDDIINAVDVNNDGKLTAVDARIILQKVAGLI